MESFEDKLSIVATLAIHLHVGMLGEDGSPERLKTLLIPPGTDFNDDFMDNDYVEDNESVDEDNEFCRTSDIGSVNRQESRDILI